MDRSFGIGDWVSLKLVAKAAVEISTTKRGKMSPRHFGPYQISEQIDPVAYREFEVTILS